MGFETRALGGAPPIERPSRPIRQRLRPINRSSMTTGRYNLTSRQVQAARARGRIFVTPAHPRELLWSWAWSRRAPERSPAGLQVVRARAGRAELPGRAACLFRGDAFGGSRKSRRPVPEGPKVPGRDALGGPPNDCEPEGDAAQETTRQPGLRAFAGSVRDAQSRVQARAPQSPHRGRAPVPELRTHRLATACLRGAGGR